MKKIFFAITMAVAMSATAGPEHKHSVEMPKAFESMKRLLGEWKGKADMGQGEQTVRVTYELTSGGTAIMETMMPGTPQEMVSMYHKDGDSLAMTHYCALGNQPRMKLTDSRADRLTFEMKGAQGIGSLKEPHMHALTLSLTDENTLQQDWLNYADGQPGQPGQPATFVFKKQ